MLVGLFGTDDLCVREATYSEALDLCTELGSRLCSVAELSRGEGSPEACGYDSAFKWSWAAPTDGMTPCTNGSLGLAGRPGEWYSFAPRVVNVFHEVRLLAEGMIDPSATFSIDTDIFS